MGEDPGGANARRPPGGRITQPMIDTLMREASSLVARGRANEMPTLARRRPWIATFYSPAQLAGSAPADSFTPLFRHSWRSDRVPRLPVFDTDSATSVIAQA